MMSQPQKEDLEKQIQHAEHEGRMVLPGIQALFGFQLVSVFNQPFVERLSDNDKFIHLGALVFTALSALLIMTPAAYHRQTEQEFISKKFLIISSRLICVSMIFLSLSICIDMDLIARYLSVKTLFAHLLSCILFSFYIGTWFVYPWLNK
jgi:hypothetical protein